MGKYRWIYIVAVLVAAIGYLATDRRQMLILLLCLILIFVLSLACWIASMLRMKYDLEADDVSICGHEIAMKIVVKSSGIAPIGSILVRMEYENLIFQDRQEQMIVLHPGNEKRMEYLLPYVADNCGKTSVRIKRMRVYDLLGIVYYHVGKGKEKDIIIYPDVKNLEITRSNNSSAKNLGESYDEFHRGHDVSEVFDMRDYQLGDNIKSIHWKLSSKLDRTIVREFGSPVNYHTALYYETEVADSYTPKERRQAQNGVLQMTASLSKAMAQTGFAHHMITIDDLKENEMLVEDNNSYLQMLSEMMSRRIPATSEEFLAQREIFAQDQRFTTLVYICSTLNMDTIRQLSRQAKLTAIYVNINQEDSVEQGNNYTIISVPVGKIDHKIQVIEF